MFGTSGIRGPVGEVVTVDLATDLGRAVAADGADRVVVGRDPRTTGPMLVDALAAGLAAGGATVVDLGLAATPTVARAVGWTEADAGVSVTASHNPPADNGFKLWTPSGQAYGADRRASVADRIESGSFADAAWDAVGDRRRRDLEARHVDAIVAAVADDEGVGAGNSAADGDAAGATDDAGSEGNRAGGRSTVDAWDEPPAVVVDVGNGAGGVTAAALGRLGCAVTTLNAQPDGHFPGRPSEPTADNCATLRAVVASGEADLGVAHDGDADRTLAVDGHGRWVPGDVLLALFARAVAGEGDRVAAPLNTSLAVDDALAARGAAVTRTRVGDVYVAERTRDDGVVFGGEPSGAWIWPTETRCPDGPLAAAKLVDLVARSGPLADLVDDVDVYPIRREAVPVDDREGRMERVRAAIADRFDEVATLDGVRVDLGDAWFLVRPSGTEPVVRVTAEARDADRADEAFELARGLVAAGS